MLHEDGALRDDRIGNDRRAMNAVVLGEQYADQIIEMPSREVANRTQLPGLVMAGDPPALDLIAGSVGGDRIDVGAGVSGAGPAERLAQKILGKIASRIVRCAGQAARPKLLADLRVEFSSAAGDRRSTFIRVLGICGPTEMRGLLIHRHDKTKL